nr:hypothetical protein BaRGS_011082 [Batillaria attramentaria]
MNCIVVPLLAAQNILADFRALALAEVNQNWENVRRFFLKTAVDHEDWDLVKQLADHNLYDDERAWLLTKALQQKKWDVAVQLADLGLQAVEMDRVYCFVAQLADWDTVLQIVEHGGDVRHIIEDLKTAHTGHENLKRLGVWVRSVAVG